MDEKKEKKHGWFGTLFGNLGKREAVEEEVAVQESAEAVEVPEMKPDLSLLPPLEGALLRLWQLWRPEEPVPHLTLKGEETDRELLLDDVGLKQEHTRLAALLEQGAKARLRILEQAEKEEKDPPAVPADCCIHVSRNGMMAWLFLFPPLNGGEEIRIDTVGQAMQESGVTSGIDSITITRTFEQKIYFQVIPVAWGTPVREGKDGRVVEHYPRKVSKEVRLDEQGNADYRAQCYVQLINKGTVICDIEPPEEGSTGIRVDGKTVEPRPVRAAKAPKGSNTSVTEDGLHLVATMDGHLEYSGSVFEVKPFLEISGDVNYSTGNIDFRGDVHIRGDVRENFSVRATGTVTIDGLVEAATVEAGADLIITRGVLGDNRALIKSGGTIRAKYLENCVAYAGSCIFADCVMSSQIFSDDRISVMGGRGTIIGGAMTAAYKVEARIIGSQSGTKTEVTLGVLPYVQDELRNIEEDMRAVQKERSELEKMLSYMEESEGMEGSSPKLAKARLRRSVLAIKEDKLTKRRQELEPMSLDLSQCRLECGTVFPVMILQIGGLRETIQTARKRCIASYDSAFNEIRFH